MTGTEAVAPNADRRCLTPTAAGRSLTASLGWRTLAAIACLTAVTLSLHLLYLADVEGCSPSLVGCHIGNAIWAQPDTTGYVRVAQAIGEHGLLGATYERRTPGYPLVLLATQRLTGSYPSALWLAVPAGALAAMCCAWLTAQLTTSRRPAIAVGVTFSVWLSVHALAPMLLTDALHAFALVASVAASLAWRASARPAWAAIAALGWMLTQALRLSFLPIALPLAILLLPRSPSRRAQIASLGLCAATLIVPLALVTSNWVHHGLASPSMKLSYAAACESVPLLKERLKLAERREARDLCRAQQLDQPPATRVAEQNAIARQFFAKFPIETLRMLGRSVFEQLVYPMRPHHRGGFEHLYPPWAVAGTGMLALFWLAAAAGIYRLFRLDPWLALFFAGCFALVMGPAALVHSAGGRYRFPLELLFLPVVALGVRDALLDLNRRLRPTS